MTVTAERFNQGMTYDAYKEQMTRNRKRFDANEKAVEVPAADKAALQSLAEPTNILVLAEDWCGDVIANLPVLGRVAQESDKLNIRVFLRDQNADIMDQYLKEGKYKSIPVFVFFDNNFNELGFFIERPATATQRTIDTRQKLYQEHPEYGAPDASLDQLPEARRIALMSEMSEAREQSKDQDNQDVIDEVLRFVTRAIH